MTAGGIRSLRSRKRGDGEDGEEGNGGNGSSTAGGGGGRGKDGEGGQPSAKRSKQDGPRIKLRTYVLWGYLVLICLCVAWPGLKGWIHHRIESKSTSASNGATTPLAFFSLQVAGAADGGGLRQFGGRHAVPQGGLRALRLRHGQGKERGKG